MSEKKEKTDGLNHVDGEGNARMVDVSEKKIQRRRARASGMIRMSASTIAAIREDQIKKGNVLAAARIAGIQSAKGTSGLIPLCHPLPLDSVELDFEFLNEGIRACCTVQCQARTGVEMEALTGTSLALLTIYDMCKAIDKDMVLDQVRLLSKEKEDLEP
jgi:cyclic pyranopterin phosphate synthase